jgi:hypothetical protein
MRHSTIMTSTVRRAARAIAAVLALAGAACSDRGAVPPATTRAPAPKPTFVNKVWRVASSSSIEPGMLYVFLSDGTLVIASPHGTPSLGSWKPAGDGLTMVEEGIPYKVDVLKLSADEFRIMINNPGNAVEIAFVPAGGEAQIGGASAGQPAPSGS